MLPLAWLYESVAATVTVHPIYFPTYVALLSVNVFVVAFVMFVPLVAPDVVAYHH